MAEVTEPDLRDLEGLLSFLRSWLQSKKELAAKLRLDKKFVGPLGEALAITRLYEVIGSSVLDLDWPGGQKRGYDVELTLKSGRKAKLQVKSTTTNNFQIFSLAVSRGCESVIREAHNQQASFSLPPEVAEDFRRQIDTRFPDSSSYYWILVSMEHTNTECFVLGKKEFRDLVIRDYERYVRDVKHREAYNYGITKDRKIRIMVNLTKRRDELEEFKDEFENLLVNESPIKKRLRGEDAN